MPETVFFSIVIPTLNEEKFLPALLRDLDAQTFHDFEVIHVDGGSSDETLSCTQKKDHAFLINCLSSPQASVAYQRNLGGQQAQGKWILFVDADTRLPAYFLQGIRYRLDKHPKTDLFSCMIDSKVYDLADRPLIEFMNVSFEVRSKIAPLAIGAFMGVRQAVFQKIQFDANLKIGEDQDFVMRVTKAGYQFRFFRDPCYIFSLRRHKKGSFLSVLRKYLASDLYILSKGQLIKDLPEYDMKGGGDYEEDWDSDDYPRS